MHEYLQKIMAYLDFPEEAAAALLADHRRLTDCPRGAETLRTWVETYDRDIHMDYAAALKAVEEAAEEAGVHRYAAGMLLYLCLTRRLGELYRQRGLDEEIYRGSCSDLLWKLRECREMYGVWGTFVAWWEPGFYELTRFALGRLQFELVDFPTGYGEPPQGMTRAINVHIPSCGRLRREEYLDAYRQAARFFAGAFPGERVAFTCSSWMLFPPNRQLLGPDSGVVGFMSDYEIFASGSENGDLWRIFGREYDGDPSTLGEETSMRRAYKAWLSAGNSAGWGSGIFFLEKDRTDTLL